MGILEGKHLSWAWKEENILLGLGLEHRRGFFLFFFLKILFIDSERDKQTDTAICCSTYLHIYWLILVCALNQQWNLQP